MVAKIARGSAEWWAPFKALADRLFRHAVLLHVDPCDNGLQCDVAVSDADENFASSEHMHLSLTIGELVTCSIMGYEVDVAKVYLAIHDVRNQGIEYNSEPIFGMPHINISGVFEGVDVSIRFIAVGGMPVHYTGAEELLPDSLYYHPRDLFPENEATDAQEPG